MSARIGVFGGTFDPPHVGHLLAVSDAAEALDLDLVLWVPAATQPFKRQAKSSPSADRLAMVRLLVADDARFAVDPLEIERAGLSYTVDTLVALRARYPDAALVLLVGADAALAVDRWKDSARVQQLAELVVLRRGGEPFVFPGQVRGRSLESRRVDVSATEIRERVQRGASIHGFVPESVAAYIARAGLYR